MDARLGARRYWPLWLGVIPACAWAAVRLLGLDGDSQFVPLLAFTPYTAVAALFLTGVAVALRNWAASLFAALAAIALLGVVLPRAAGAGEPVPARAQILDVLSANVYKGKADPAALVGLVRRFKPDVLAVQELDPKYDRALRAAGIERLLPNSIVLLRLPGLHGPPDKHKRRPGIGVYSGLDLDRLPRAATTSSSRLEVSLPGGGAVRLVNFHPLTPLRPQQIGRWRQTLDTLPSAGAGEPWIVLGDFNATLDQDGLRDVLDRGYRDAAAVTGRGLEGTWPADTVYPPLITIDHVLADRRVGIASYGVSELRGSDHMAIQARLFFPEGLADSRD